MKNEMIFKIPISLLWVTVGAFVVAVFTVEFLTAEGADITPLPGTSCRVTVGSFSSREEATLAGKYISDFWDIKHKAVAVNGTLPFTATVIFFGSEEEIKARCAYISSLATRTTMQNADLAYQ